MGGVGGSCFQRVDQYGRSWWELLSPLRGWISMGGIGGSCSQRVDQYGGSWWELLSEGGSVWEELLFVSRLIVPSAIFGVHCSSVGQYFNACLTFLYCRTAIADLFKFQLGIMSNKGQHNICS